ncbi:MAG: H-X9-DG-CTERM domain-containing protein [Planctomycetaceae bacterium]
MPRGRLSAHPHDLSRGRANGCFRPGEPRRLREITDGISTTLLVFEAPVDQAVPWMSPYDADAGVLLNIGPKTKLAHVGGINTALGDGSVRLISESTPADTRRALISIADGDTFGDW